MTGREMIRVEHYGKGDPEWSTIYNQSRPVPAVTGAFISIDRDWFEHLSGFTEDFVFGHYEDADLCLKSISQGYAPWMHDIRMWHLEGKGSTRLPVHEGGSYVNRAFFSAQWDNFIKDGLVGKHPTHPLLSLPAPSNASKATNSAAPQKKDRKA
jgi:GT2 family glycosyltransferase